MRIFSFILTTLLALVLANGIVIKLSLNSERESFIHKVEDITTLFNEKIVTTLAVQSTIARFHQASTILRRNEYAAISLELIESYPYISALYYAEWTSKNTLDTLLETMHKQGFVGFKIKPISSGLDSDALLPIIAVEPLKPLTSRTLGVDLLSDTANIKTLTRSIHQNTAGVMTLQGITSQHALLISLPVYYGIYIPQESDRLDQIKGISLIEINLKQLLERVVHENDMNLSVRYGDQPELASLTNDTNKLDNTWLVSGFTETTSIPISDSKISLEFNKNFNVLEQLRFELILTSVLSIVVSLLFFLYIFERLLLLKQREQARKDMRRQQQKAEVTLKAISDAVITLDDEGTIMYLNPVAEQLLGKSSGDVIGQSFSDIVFLSRTENSDSFVNTLGINSMQPVDNQIGYLRNSDNQFFDIEYSIAALENHAFDRIGTVLTISDLTKETQLKEELVWHAEHDALTGLYNRRVIEHKISELITFARGGTNSVMFYIDLDNFKVVNDTCGHHAGDQLLLMITSTLSDMLRDSDVLGRLGGDEFAVLLPECPLKVAESIANRIVKVIDELQFSWEGKPYSVGASVGVVEINRSFNALHDVLMAADLACYAAKDKGKGTSHVYHTEDVDVSRHHNEMSWFSVLRDALDNHKFIIYQQLIYPTFSSSNLPVMHELLVRLETDNGNIISPGEFIPAAERYSLMLSIDANVVEQTLQWVSHIKHTTDIFTINLSGQSLANAMFRDHVSQLLNKYDLGNARICFEITETAYISSHVQAKQFIQHMSRKGCLFALDDFGSGLSSFGYMKDFAIDYLKIDMQFISDIASNPVNHAIVRAIRDMAKDLSIMTIAEGIMDEQTLSICGDLGINYVQGYAISDPLAVSYDTGNIPVIEFSKSNGNFGSGMSINPG